MCQCNAVLLHRLSSPHSLNALGLGHMLKSTSGTEPSPPLHTHDTTPIKGKVALQLTVLQGIGYHSTAHTVYSSQHQGGHRHCTGRRTSIDTLYVVTTARVPLHMYNSILGCTSCDLRCRPLPQCLENSCAISYIIYRATYLASLITAGAQCLENSCAIFYRVSPCA